MADMTVRGRVPVARLIVIPSLIALAVTLLRLTGELLRWSPRWFDNEGGGVTPSGVSWVVGITWLAAPFGIYFALRLIAAGERPPSAARAVAFAAAGLVALEVGVRFITPLFDLDTRPRLLLIWAFGVLPAALAIRAWPALWRVLLAYGLASRLPVAVLMFLAMRGTWGTHYDYGGQVPVSELGYYYVWFGLVPQMVFWVCFTILLGLLTGSITALVKRRRPAEQSANA